MTVRLKLTFKVRLSLLSCTSIHRGRTNQPRWRKPNDYLVLPSRICSSDRPARCAPDRAREIGRSLQSDRPPRFAKSEGLSKAIVHPAKILSVELVKQILGFDRPMTADHALDTAAHCPAPIKVFCVRIDAIELAGQGAAVVAHSPVPIECNAAARRIRQP